MEMVYIKINADERKNFSSHEQVQLMSVQQLKVFFANDYVGVLL